MATADDKGYVAIKDGVAYSTGSHKDQDFEYHVVARGQEIPADVDAKRIKEWLDPIAHPPYGAIAPKGSELARLGSAGASVATDPAAANRALAAAHARLAGKDEDADPNAGLVDPAGRDVTEPVHNQDPSVASTQRLSLDGMDKDQLKTQAAALGVTVGARDSADKIREKINAKLAESGPDETGETGTAS